MSAFPHTSNKEVAMQRRLFLWGLVMSWVAGAPGMASALTLDADSCKPSCQLQITRMHNLTWDGAGYPGGQNVECLPGHTGLGNWVEKGIAVAGDTAGSTAPIFPGALDKSGMGFVSWPRQPGGKRTPLAHSRRRVLASGLRVVGGGGAEPEVYCQAMHFTLAYTGCGVLLRQKFYQR